jgi:RecA/RadA recombinase
MAKKKSDSTAVFGEFFSAQMAAAQTSLGRSDMYIGSEAQEVVIGLPFRAFSLRYLFQNDCFPLSRMTELYGPSGSCKTALLFEIFKWHVDNKGGYAYNLTEARDTPDLRASIIGHDRDRGFPTFTCSSVEDWQRAITGWLKKSNEMFPVKGSCPFPAAIGVDSLTGVTTDGDISDIWEKGAASIGFARSANLINTYCKFMFNELRVWPFSFIGVNHMKISQDKRGFTFKKAPGGDALTYHATIKIRTELKESIEKLNECVRAVNLVMEKNSLSNAGENRQLLVNMKWRTDEDGVQHTIWDWHEATITAINGLSPTKKAHVCKLLELENIDKAKRTADCGVLGLTKTSWSEISQAIEDNEEVRKALDHMIGIRKRKPFQLDTPYYDQMSAACAES